MFENELDVTPEVVPPEETQVANPEETLPVTEEEKTEPPEQTPEENARFADQRRKQELDAVKRQLSAEKEEKERLANSLSIFGYTGSAQEIADAIEAQKRSVAPEQVRAERESENRRISELEERHKADLMMLEDLHQLQRINPAIKNVNELGDEFYSLRFARDGYGKLLHTAESAYLEIQKRKAPKPKANDKEHLVPTGGSASSSNLVEIPAGELAIYEDAFPNDSPAKLRERYNRVRERQGD